jgi:hypothetical protein
MKIRAAKKITYYQGAWVTDVPDPFVWYSIAFNKHIKHTNKALIRKAVLLTSKHWQKLRLNCFLA